MPLRGSQRHRGNIHGPTLKALDLRQKCIWIGHVTPRLGSRERPPEGRLLRKCTAAGLGPQDRGRFRNCLDVTNETTLLNPCEIAACSTRAENAVFRVGVNHAAASTTAKPTPMADKPPITDANHTISRSSSHKVFHMCALPHSI